MAGPDPAPHGPRAAISARWRHPGRHMTPGDPWWLLGNPTGSPKVAAPHL